MAHPLASRQEFLLLGTIGQMDSSGYRKNFNQVQIILEESLLTCVML
jgi:hypothetical protein